MDDLRYGIFLQACNRKRRTNNINSFIIFCILICFKLVFFQALLMFENALTNLKGGGELKDLSALRVSIKNAVFVSCLQLHFSFALCCFRKYPYSPHGRFFCFEPPPLWKFQFRLILSSRCICYHFFTS